MSGKIALRPSYWASVSGGKDSLYMLSRWYAEREGQVEVGRVLPADYLWFSGDGERNHFRNAYRGGDRWDWSLPSPYES